MQYNKQSLKIIQPSLFSKKKPKRIFEFFNPSLTALRLLESNRLGEVNVVLDASFIKA